MRNAVTTEKEEVVSLMPDATSISSVRDRRWWILGVVGLAQLMVVLDATIVNIALPSAQRDLGFSNADRQWVVTAYSLASVACCCSAGGCLTWWGAGGCS